MTHPNREELAAVSELLKDSDVVHLNMLHGKIAKPTPAQIGHLYRGEQAAEVVREVIRQNPSAAEALRQSPSVGEVAAIIRKHAVSSGGEPCTPRESVTAAQAIVALCQAQSRKDSPND